MRACIRSIGVTRAPASRLGAWVTGLLISALSSSIAGCAGIQGGNEGEESEACIYDDEQLSGADQVAAGFLLTPREAFSPALQVFAGEVGARATTLELASSFDDLRASYSRRKRDACPTRLFMLGSATLNLAIPGRAPAIATGPAELDYRGQTLTASVTLTTAMNPELVALAQELSAHPVASATLSVGLSDFTPAGAVSTWRWWLEAACGVGCSRVEEVSWGAAELTRENDP